MLDTVPCFQETHWLFRERWRNDTLSMGQLTIAAGCPYIAHERGSTPRALKLLAHAGFAPAERLLRYRDEADYRAIVEQLTDEGYRIAVNHVHARDVLADDQLWIPRDLVSALNDKGEIARWTSAHPARRATPTPPVVIKVSTDGTTGAGLHVRVCPDADAARRAVEDLAGASALVFEEMLDIESNWCVQFVIDRHGAIESLGSAEQVCDEDGNWLGNWIDGSAPDELARLAREVAQAGADAGYFGLVGVDVVHARDGRNLVIDANFRFNGSSVALLFRHEYGVGRSRAWGFAGSYAEMTKAVAALVEEERFLPFGSWDDDAHPRVLGVAHGPTREHAEESLRLMETRGFTT